jgi:hypothetical protein
MRGIGAAWPRIAIVGALGLALAGCADVDEALFGPYPGGQTAAKAPANAEADNSESAPAPEASAQQTDQTAEAQTPSQPSSPPASAEASALPPDTQTAAVAPEAETPPPTESGQLPGTLPPAGPSVASAATVTPVAAASFASNVRPIRIEPGRNTGTAVGKTVAGLRGEIIGIENKLMENARRLGVLRQGNARATERYQNSRAVIMTRLQVGTTRGNPELVNQWNVAQGSLDQLATNLNSLGNIGADATNDTTAIRQALQQITAAYDLAGGVDDDHRQLSVLEDEARQMLVSCDRLRKEVSADIPRQASFIAAERASLAQLANSIKRGDIYSSAGTQSYASVPDVPVALASADASQPLVVIKFNRPNVSYQQILLSALQQALKSRPSAAFKIVAVTPTRGSAAEVARAQGASKRHAEDVLQSMTDMGVPATRLQVASSTDPQVQAAEVRVFVI